MVDEYKPNESVTFLDYETCKVLYEAGYTELVEDGFYWVRYADGRLNLEWWEDYCFDINTDPDAQKEFGIKEAIPAIRLKTLPTILKENKKSLGLKMYRLY